MSSKPPEINIPPQLAQVAARAVCVRDVAQRRHDVAAKQFAESQVELEKAERALREVARAIQLAATVAPQAAAPAIAAPTNGAAPQLAAGEGEHEDAGEAVLAWMQAQNTGAA